MMKIYVDKRIWFSKDLDMTQLESLKLKFTYTFEESYAHKVEGKVQIDSITRTVCTLLEINDYYVLPRGCLSRLEDFLSTYDISYEISYNLTSININSSKIIHNYELWDYQIKAKDAMIAGEYGIVEAPCGSGKTMIAIGIIGEIRQTTLIIVHTSVLLSQWKKSLEKHLGINNIGIFGVGGRSFSPITIGMVQSLNNLPKSSFEKLSKVFGCVICDEAHHVPAETFVKTITQFSPSNLYGLTATPKRKDGKHFLLTDFIGPTRYKITDDALIEDNKITDAEVKWIETKIKFDVNSWNKMIDKITNSYERNSIIIKETIDAVNNGHFIIILSERVMHCEMLSGMFDSIGYNNLCFSGDSWKKVSSKVYDNTIDYGDTKIIIATTSIAKEGLDVPQISCVVIATPINNQYVLKQIIGRGRRKKEKKTLIIDLRDDGNSMMNNIANNREKWYNSWNFYQVDDGINVNVRKEDEVKNDRIWGKK